MIRKYRFWLVIGITLLAMAAAAAYNNRAEGQGPPDGTTPGPWTGTAVFGPPDAPTTAEMSFQVTESGQVAGGVITLAFSYPNMPEDVLNLMLEHGCDVSFNEITATSQPVAGTFTNATQATGTFNTASCLLEGFGELAFVTPLTGTWTAEAAGAAPPPDDATPRPTRRPTLDPSQPTAPPTQPGADTEPTPRPTRRPTLDPSQPTPVPTKPGPAETAQDASAAPAGVDDGAAANISAPAAESAPPGPGPDDEPPHENDGMSGRELYNFHCEECHGNRGLGTEDAPELEALNAQTIADTTRDGPEDMDPFSHEDLPDRHLNILIDFILKFHPDSTPRTEYITTPRE